MPVPRSMGGLRGWGKRSNSTFPEHGHGAYQIEVNHECSSMESDIFSCRPLPTPPTDPGVRVKGQNSTFSENGHVTYQIRESRMHQHCSINFTRRPSPPPHQRFLGWVNRS